jgi:hypothetical protein
MTRKDIILMADASGLSLYGMGKDREQFIDYLECFADLIASAEREKYKWDIHSCSPTCNRYVCVAKREAVLAEREACAKVCDEFPDVGYIDEKLTSDYHAHLIRQRGQA